MPKTIESSINPPLQGIGPVEKDGRLLIDEKFLDRGAPGVDDTVSPGSHYSQSIIEAIHDPLLVLDSNLNVVTASRSFYKKFHVTGAETENQSLFELGDKQWDILRLRELLETLLLKNAHFEDFEVTHVFPGLGEKIMLLNASRIIQKPKREKLVLLVIKDVTERSMRQRKADGKNKENIRIYQQDKLELEQAVKDRTKQLELKNIELETANKKLVFQNREKEKRAAELGIANTELAFQNEEKEKRAIELSIANTELAFQNDEKEKRTIELNIANQALTSFTYISSHDLQEPLRKIQIFATCILKEEENLSETGKNYFKKMMNTANRMQHLIDDLLTYSRTKSGDRIFEDTDINKMLDEIKKDLEETLREKKVTVEAGELRMVKVIPFQFRQLLHNLFSNALKFSKPGVPPHIIIKSKIELGTSLSNKGLQASKKYCHIAFTDNGIGFDPQYKDLIFEVFQRLHSAEQYTGTGIGLAICKRIVENHNGIITATGKPDEGVTFDIYIPA